ncbi:hypothetical protein JB92DRAFT_3103040 [Gautieria morchelliformis]|nr:hypothetical protein JB92DRAFT_3103040 [Gautieria morchelliformis]
MTALCHDESTGLAHLSCCCWCWETKWGRGSHDADAGVANLGATPAAGGTQLAARGHTSIGWDAGAQLPSRMTLEPDLDARDGGRCADVQVRDGVSGCQSFLVQNPHALRTKVVEGSTFGFCTRAHVRIACNFRWEVLAGQEGKVEGGWWPVIVQ